MMSNHRCSVSKTRKLEPDILDKLFDNVSELVGALDVDERIEDGVGGREDDGELDKVLEQEGVGVTQHLLTDVTGIDVDDVAAVTRRHVGHDEAVDAELKRDDVRLARVPDCRCRNVASLTDHFLKLKIYTLTRLDTDGWSFPDETCLYKGSIDF